MICLSVLWLEECYQGISGSNWSSLDIYVEPHYHTTMLLLNWETKPDNFPWVVKRIFHISSRPIVGNPRCSLLTFSHKWSIILHLLVGLDTGHCQQNNWLPAKYQLPVSARVQLHSFTPMNRRLTGLHSFIGGGEGHYFLSVKYFASWKGG